MGRSCSAAVEHTPRHLEVVGSNPVGCWFFSSFHLFLPSFTSGVSLIRRGLKVETCSISTDWVKNTRPFFQTICCRHCICCSVFTICGSLQSFATILFTLGLVAYPAGWGSKAVADVRSRSNHSWVADIPQW